MSLPSYLRIEQDNGKPVFVGRSGQRYPVWNITERLYDRSLRLAIFQEEIALAQQGIDVYDPGIEERQQ